MVNEDICGFIWIYEQLSFILSLYNITHTDMKNILYLLPLILFYSCVDNLNKSVFESLSLKELDEEIKKDSLFGMFYEHIQAINKNTLDTDTKRAKYANLTLRRAYSSYTYHDDKLEKQLSSEWNNKYKTYSSKADSISRYWRKAKQDNSLDQYVKIELASISTKYYSFGGVDEVNIGFKLIPLKSKVEQLRFGYSIEPKIYKKEGKNEYDSYLSILDKSWCLSTSPFSQPVVRYWEANYKDENKLAGMDVETVLRDYDVNIEVDKIRIDGRNLSSDDVKVPFSVEMYWKYEDETDIQNIYEEDIIKEFIDDNYISSFRYILNGVNERRKEVDELAFEYLNLPSKKEKEEL